MSLCTQAAIFTKKNFVSFGMFLLFYRPETNITASLHDQVDKLEKHLRYGSIFVISVIYDLLFSF